MWKKTKKISIKDLIKSDSLYQMMNDLFEKGEIKEAAFYGWQILNRYKLTSLIIRQTYNFAFDEKIDRNDY